MNKKLIVLIITCIIFLCSTILLGFQYININLEFKNVQDNFLIMKNELETTQNELIEAQENIQIEINKSIDLNNKLSQAIDAANTISAELAVANIMIEDLKKEEYELVYMGDFKITYYCDGRYQHICGGNGITASGKPTEVGWTAAADWVILPSGSIVYIEGIGFREIQDVGGSVDGNHIDVLVQEHQEAINLGTSYEGVWILVKKNS